MRYLLMSLLVLLPAILYGIALIAVGLTARFYRSRCPECQQRGLKMIGFIRATVLINGQRAPDHWTDYRCLKCGVVRRWHRKQWESVSQAAVRRQA